MNQREQGPLHSSDQPGPLEQTVRSVMVTLIFIALAVSAGRIAVVRSAGGEVPFLSANDRSRWATVSALVEDGTYHIDRQTAIRDPETRRRTWQSIDRVRHVGRDGKMHDYSSKPPLLATMIAGIYAVVKPILGMTLTSHPLYVGRVVLALTNLPLLGVLLAAMMGVVQASSRSAWARLFAMAAASFGTMLLPFSVTLNNHLPAATAAAIVLWILLDPQRRRQWKWVFVAGIAAAMVAANELPGLTVLGLWGLIVLVWNPKAAIFAFTPGVALVAVAFFGTNWIAHESWRPPYAHRGNGPLITEFDHSEMAPEPDMLEGADGGNSESRPVPSAEAIGAALVEAGKIATPDVSLTRSEEPGRWIVETPDQNGRFAVLVGASETWEIREWDDWYDYEGSYWTSKRRQGVDRGEPSRLVYAFHVLLGHHGLLSLTPLWLLAILGAVYWLRDGDSVERSHAAAIVLATFVCMTFYLMRPLIDRNYGGVSSTFRWMLWFAPLWLWLLVPAADRWGNSRWGRGVSITLLALSVFSVSTALANPWQPPWLYKYWLYLGWLVE